MVAAFNAGISLRIDPGGTDQKPDAQEYTRAVAVAA
jgi:hypothetical protein